MSKNPKNLIVAIAALTSFGASAADSYSDIMRKLIREGAATHEEVIATARAYEQDLAKASKVMWTERYHLNRVNNATAILNNVQSELNQEASDAHKYDYVTGTAEVISSVIVPFGPTYRAPSTKGFDKYVSDMNRVIDGTKKRLSNYDYDGAGARIGYLQNTISKVRKDIESDYAAIKAKRRAEQQKSGSSWWRF